MSENSPTAPPNPGGDDQHADQPETGPTDDAEGIDSEPHDSSPNAEAARYRRQLREVEAERDGLAERLQGHQRREVEAMVADLLDVPADLFDIGQVQASDFYNDDGTLNEGELRAAAGALLEERPRLGKPRPAGQRWQNFGQFAPPPPQRGAAWSDVLGS
ncbi:hypothetical protein A5773_13900 [Mycobacterium sp. 852014-52450_SCH5900713]|uniref:hypothetical protein n=1 Tax=Mycobacterium sp. 852014-52450_SCH5900713 TaxID=1834116 RepID=UPI0007FD7CCA|nr:hypothetical protein [Mycobacterium sp. 852014-52450_SCH5900713]OBF95714.1 hypothetical protein A5773_13900 [Mycobacterium sp. 852014-52450_SCH5900713]